MLEVTLDRSRTYFGAGWMWAGCPRSLSGSCSKLLWVVFEPSSDILIRPENDLAQFAATATAMNGAFFPVSGLWPLGPMVPNHSPTCKRGGAENKAPDQEISEGIAVPPASQGERMCLARPYDDGRKPYAPAEANPGTSV